MRIWRVNLGARGGYKEIWRAERARSLLDDLVARGGGGRGRLNHKAQTTNHNPQPKNHKPQTTNHKPQTTTHKPQTTNHKPQTTNHKPQTTSHKPQTANHKPQTTNHKPHTANCQVQVRRLLPNVIGCCSSGVCEAAGDVGAAAAADDDNDDNDDNCSGKSAMPMLATGDVREESQSLLGRPERGAER